MLKNIKRVRVIGFPFAATRRQAGSIDTPEWLATQDWFKRQAHVELQVLGVNPLQPSDHGAHDHARIMWRLEKLQLAINQAYADNTFPLVLGGDSSQTVGCLNAFKQQAANGRLLLLDQCHRNVESSEDAAAFRMTDELQRSKEFEPEKDLVLVGANTQCIQGLKAQSLRNNAKVVSQRHCNDDSAELVNGVILHHLKTRGTVDPFWISLNANVLKPTEFLSNAQAHSTDEGVPLSFVRQFLSRFGSHAAGLDLSEVNFHATNGAWRHADQQTFRELMELVFHQVNQTDQNEQGLNQHFSEWDIISSDISH